MASLNYAPVESVTSAREAAFAVSPGELAGVARWNDDFTVQLCCDDAAIDVVTAPGRRVVLVGELHDDSPPAMRDRLGAMSPGSAAHGLRALGGAFAGVLVDAAAHTVILFTDHFGIRPLYYWSDRDQVVFATRLCDIARLRGVRSEIDDHAVSHYLHFSCVPVPATMFRGVSVLPPACLARRQNGTLRVQAYWDATYSADARGSDHELARALRDHLERAVTASLPRSEPKTIGCFLSGGTDSGTIASIMAQRISPAQAFSVGFAEEGFDELPFARAIASRRRLAHYTACLTPHDALASIHIFASELDQPFGNPSLIATWRCTRLAHERGVALLLAGDGGDELFGGNERYATDYVYRRYMRLPALVRRATAAALERLPGRTQAINRVRHIASRGMLPNPERLFADYASSTLLRAGLHDGAGRHASLDLMREYYSRPVTDSELNRLLYVDLKMVLAGNDLVKVTTAGRLAGVRVRFPMLDRSLAEFTGTLPAHLKVRGRQKRYLFNQAVADLLPEQTIRRRKHGFSTPISNWIRSDRRVRDAVIEPVVDSSGLVSTYVTRSAVERLVDDHLRSRWDHGSSLWSLAHLAYWHRAHTRAYASR